MLPIHGIACFPSRKIMWLRHLLSYDACDYKHFPPKKAIGKHDYLLFNKANQRLQFNKRPSYSTKPLALTLIGNLWIKRPQVDDDLAVDKFHIKAPAGAYAKHLAHVRSDLKIPELIGRLFDEKTRVHNV